MNRKTASLLFLSVCALLAVLLLAGVISPVTGAALFAVALLVFGGLSRGFRKDDNHRATGDT